MVISVFGLDSHGRVRPIIVVVFLILRSENPTPFIFNVQVQLRGLLTQRVERGPVGPLKSLLVLWGKLN